MRYLVTGATGFVGQALTQALISQGHEVHALVRNKEADLPIGAIAFEAEFGKEQAQPRLINQLSEALQEVEVVIHTAARVHVMDETTADPLSEFRAINRDATLLLAELAAQTGVKRFVFLSSIKVNGEKTEKDKPFTAEDTPHPTDPYGVSKLEAEQGLLELSRKTQMDVVIIRPPLVYGPGVKANFAVMMKWVKRGIPLPFACVDNRRSLVALDNLIDFIELCASPSRAPNAANEVFLVADTTPVSTRELLQSIAAAYGQKARLWPLPVRLMTMGATLLGKKALSERLFGNLEVDTRKNKNVLSWQAKTSLTQQLKKMIETT
ncbi:MAG: SDR family oxidoreductase [Thiomicrorhabdus chilensis]|uniref:UDP-glucose 4-epimerase family protein n=1 Tax=Thiomicrorhabdus chilensis TaxID=63656 RepID=UPI00299EB241|nr:SDR family oxidoreductase [Thiomicrorhabdus chilensis]MDX1347438.1 SDR family oxidoreductase [Thiomicrorhabdus chilensis]